MDPTLIPQSFLSRKEESFDQSKTQQSFKGLSNGSSKQQRQLTLDSPDSRRLERRTSCDAGFSQTQRVQRVPQKQARITSIAEMQGATREFKWESKIQLEVTCKGGKFGGGCQKTKARGKHPNFDACAERVPQCVFRSTGLAAFDGPLLIRQASLCLHQRPFGAARSARNSALQQACLHYHTRLRLDSDEK